jgi:hypothetical protein
VIGREPGVVEPLAGNAAEERHLTTFETEADGSARARLLSLVSAARSLAVTGAFPAAEALAAVFGPGTGSEFVKSHKNDS